MDIRNKCSLCKIKAIDTTRNKSGMCGPCYSKNWIRNNKEYMVDKQKEWSTKNPSKRKEYNDKNYKKHGHKQIAKKKIRYHEDILYRLRHNLRNRLYCAIKREYKAGSAVSDLGCSIEEFKAYLESKFQPGMSWDERSEWHIDHVVPLNSFDLTNSDDVKKACHHTNLQPLWKRDNIVKGDKL